MGWAMFTLSLRLRGDIHCGDLPLGFVARTHPFVPCHIPFFALIPATVETLGMPDERASYKAVEQLFSDCLRSTPLYVKDDQSSRFLFPWDDTDREVLESRYLGSRYGVALDDHPRSARQGCLYETEVLLASPRGSTNPTRLEGALFVHEGEKGGLRIDAGGTVHWGYTSASLATALSRVHLGGDRTRALGRPADTALAEDTGPLWRTYPVHCDGTWPVLEIPCNTPGPLPVAMDRDTPSVQGTPLMLTGRRHTPQGPGMGMDTGTAAYAQGWKAGSVCRVQLDEVRCAHFVP